MEIKYLGHASFFIKTKDACVVTDPFNSDIGVKFPKTEADIVTISHQHADHNNVSGVAGAPLIVEWPGEFEKNKVRIIGYKSYHDKKQGAERGENILYKIEAEGITILHCGDLGFVPDDKLLDEIGDVDILCVPVGGFYTINSAEAVELIKTMEPSIVIPMHYNHSHLNQETFANLAPVEDFLKKMNVENGSPLPKLVVKKEDLVEEEMKVVVLNSEF